MPIPRLIAPNLHSSTHSIQSTHSDLAGRPAASRPGVRASNLHFKVHTLQFLHFSGSTFKPTGFTMLRSPRKPPKGQTCLHQDLLPQASNRNGASATGRRDNPASLSLPSPQMPLTGHTTQKIGYLHRYESKMNAPAKRYFPPVPRAIDNAGDPFLPEPFTGRMHL